MRLQGGSHGGKQPLSSYQRALHTSSALLLHPTRSLPAQELDPASKFASEWDGWRWQATRAGQKVPFASCCTASGFSAECTCAPRSDCSTA